MDEQLSVPPPAAEIAPEPIAPPAPPFKTIKETGGAVFAPRPSIEPERRTETRRKSKLSTYLSLAATLLFIVFAGLWLTTSDVIIEKDPTKMPDVGSPTNPSPTTSPQIIPDSLRRIERRLPDSSNID